MASKKAERARASAKAVEKVVRKVVKKAAKALSPKSSSKPAAKAAQSARKGSVAAKSKAAPAVKPQRRPVVDAKTEKGTPDAKRLGVGGTAPSFELTDDAGAVVSSRSLRGKPYVLYFYPKDDTPGCTVEACGFRDAFPRFGRKGVKVLGVSPDSVASHERFKKKYGLTFPLLSDPEKTLAKAYGVWVLKQNYGREYMGIERSTFLVDASGKIKAAWRGVRVPGHVDAVFGAL